MWAGGNCFASWSTKRDGMGARSSLSIAHSPSSKRCSVCGHELESLSLAVREWTCPTCGAVHDRDVNAACNTKAEGLAVFACGERVESKPAWNQGRHASTKQETHLVRGGLPFPVAEGIGRRSKSISAAQCPVERTTPLVAMPHRTSEVTPWARRIVSSGVVLKAPVRDLARTTSPGPGATCG